MPDIGRIQTAVLQEGKLVITLSDKTFLILTLDQLLGLGVTRHRIPPDLNDKPASKQIG